MVKGIVLGKIGNEIPLLQTLPSSLHSLVINATMGMKDNQVRCVPGIINEKLSSWVSICQVPSDSKPTNPLLPMIEREYHKRELVRKAVSNALVNSLQLHGIFFIMNLGTSLERLSMQ